MLSLGSGFSIQISNVPETLAVSEVAGGHERSYDPVSQYLVGGGFGRRPVAGTGRAPASEQDPAPRGVGPPHHPGPAADGNDPGGDLRGSDLGLRQLRRGPRNGNPRS